MLDLPRTGSSDPLSLNALNASSHVQILELLLLHEAPIDTRNKQHWTPLHRAAQNNHTRAATLLVENGATLRAVNQDGNTPLHIACQANHLAMIKLLLQLGADSSTTNAEGKTPLDVCLTDIARDAVGKTGVTE
mmetsp:Transcript_33214/g.98926  ORF Transcript_33214/g.98926 Transcript_33214/m.98926 type:complete len:134 (-) Transcript_33214:2172-2573(-)